MLQDKSNDIIFRAVLLAISVDLSIKN